MASLEGSDGGASQFKLGVMFRRAGRHAAAVKLFRQALVDGMEKEAKCHFNLAASLHECRTAADSNDDEALTHYLRAATLDSSGAAGIAPDAKANAAALHLLRGDPASALALCEEVLSVDALDSKQRFQPVAWCNLNTALRQLGRYDEAVARSWDALQELTNSQLMQPSYFHNTSIDTCTNSVAQSTNASSNCSGVEISNGVGNKDSTVSRSVVACCVKWGTKYCSDDVNRLAAGLQRHLLQKNSTEISSTYVDSNSTTHRRVVCFTDDPSGLDLTLVEAAPLPYPNSSDKAKSGANDSSISMPEGVLPKGLMGWWYKAYLFSEDAAAILGSGTRVVYIDLDTVIVGSLAPLLAYSGSFGTLGTDGMVSERRDHGLNSSVMVWSAGEWNELWRWLVNHFSAVATLTYKFDVWVEMVVGPLADRLQNLFPGLLHEYGQVAATDNGAIVQSFATTEVTLERAGETQAAEIGKSTEVHAEVSAFDEKGGAEMTMRPLSAEQCLPAGAGLVTFPLEPKPRECHDVLAIPWVQEHWTLLQRT